MSVMQISNIQINQIVKTFYEYDLALNDYYKEYLFLNLFLDNKNLKFKNSKFKELCKELEKYLNKHNWSRLDLSNFYEKNNYQFYQLLGQELLEINLDAFNCRYNEKSDLEKFKLNLHHNLLTSNCLPQIIELIKSLNYNSYESSIYDNSFAKYFLKEFKIKLLEKFLEKNLDTDQLEWTI
jgi:hypothetical protein